MPPAVGAVGVALLVLAADHRRGRGQLVRTVVGRHRCCLRPPGSTRPPRSRRAPRDRADDQAGLLLRRALDAGCGPRRTGPGLRRLLPGWGRLAVRACCWGGCGVCGCLRCGVAVAGLGLWGCCCGTSGLAAAPAAAGRRGPADRRPGCCRLPGCCGCAVRARLVVAHLWVPLQMLMRSRHPGRGTAAQARRGTHRYRKNPVSERGRDAPKLTP